MSGATMILSPPGRTISSFAEVMQPGTVAAMFQIEARTLDEFEKQRALVEIYLANDVPIILEFEDEADADELRRRWGFACEWRPQ